MPRESRSRVIGAPFVLVVPVFFALGLAQFTSGCSALLDFSASQVPIDAEIDAPWTQDQCDYKEPNNSSAEAALFAVTDSGPAAICPSAAGEDHDFYRFTVPAGTATVVVKVDFLTPAIGDLDLRLFNATTGTMESQSRSFGSQEVITCPASTPPCGQLAAGDYVFEVFPAKATEVNSYVPSLQITPM